jgi:hypothetical protein
MNEYSWVIATTAVVGLVVIAYFSLNKEDDSNKNKQKEVKIIYQILKLYFTSSKII